MTTTTTTNNMKYIQLSRVLDNEAQNNGYDYCPDDLLCLILDYSGDINRYSSCFYQIRVRYEYRFKSRGMNDNGNLYSYGVWCDGSRWIKYCSCCDRFYQSIDSHLRRDIHRRNFNYDDLLINPDFMVGLTKEYKRRYYDYQIRNIVVGEWTEWFLHKPIQPLEIIIKKKKIRKKPIKLKGG